MAKSVARQLAPAVLRVRIQISLKNRNGRHKQRSGRHTLARQKKYIYTIVASFTYPFQFSNKGILVHNWTVHFIAENRALIINLLMSPRINSKESMQPTYEAWTAGPTNPIPTRFLAPIDCLNIPAQELGEKRGRK